MMDPKDSRSYERCSDPEVNDLRDSLRAEACEGRIEEDLESRARKVPLKGLAAIQYLIRNGDHSSEWAEAGLLREIERVALAYVGTEWTKDELDEMLADAAEN